MVIDRSEHPIQETARNLGPALLVVTFDAVFAFAALQFAKVPMIRDFGLLLAVGIAVICIGSIIVPLAVLGIREFRVADQGRGLPRGSLGRLVVWLGSLPPRCAVPLAIVSVAIFVGGISVEDKLDAPDRPGEVGRTRRRRSSRTSARSRTRSAGRPSSACSSTAEDVFTDESSTTSTTFTARSRWSSTRRICSSARASSTTIGDLIARARRRATPSPRGRGRAGGLRASPRPTSRSSTVVERRQGVQHRVPHRAGLARGTRCSWSIGSPRRHDAAARGIRRDAVGPRGRRRRAARQPRGEPDPADLPRDRCSSFIFLAIRLRSSSVRCSRWCRC